MKILKNKGFALLLATVIAGLVLTIGLALSLLAKKEYGISNTNRDSQIADQAAKTGSDCAVKYATDLVKNYKSASPVSPYPLDCNTGATVNATLSGNVYTID